MNYEQIPLTRLSVALALVGVTAVVARSLDLRVGRDLARGAVRAAVQLLAVGYALVALFRYQRPVWVLLAMTVMLCVAAWTSARRVESGPGARVLLPYALVSIAAGSAVALVPVFLFVVQPRPWYAARYLVPMGGMMLASAMNVVAQVFERLFSLARSDAASIEQLLALGATPRQALAPSVRAAVRASLIPTLNSLMTVGLVALPGMMTGQIVSGTPPEQAVRYQVVVMYQLVVVAAVAGALAAVCVRRVLFTPRAQLRGSFGDDDRTPAGSPVR